jgi:hypothetical protein
MSKRKLLQLVEEGLVSRLGRSAHANIIGNASQGLYSGIDP